MLGARLIAALNALEAVERERDDVGSAYVMASGMLASEQMRSAVATKERDTARAQVETLAEALRWYADRVHWDFQGAEGERPALIDYGERARDALDTTDALPAPPDPR
jgi:uncharacterized Ntn-hydrolase superfamily protein